MCLLTSSNSGLGPVRALSGVTPFLTLLACDNLPNLGAEADYMAIVRNTPLAQ